MQSREKINTKQLNQDLIYAAKCGIHKDVVRLINKGINPLCEHGEAIRQAITNGHTKVIKYFFKNNKVVMEIRNNPELFILAVSLGHVEIINLFINKKAIKITSFRGTKTYLKAITTAAFEQHPEVIKVLLDLASKKQAYFDFALTMFIRDASGGEEYRNAFIFAVEIGNYNIVKTLLDTGYFSYLTSLAIEKAAKKNFIDVLELLLQYEYANPEKTYRYDRYLQQVAENDNFEAIKMLLDYKRIEITSGCIRNSEIARKGYVNTFKLLVEYDQHNIIPSSDDYNDLLIYAVENRKAELVKSLVEEGKAYSLNFSIRHAAINGYTEIVTILLNDERVDPLDRSYSSFRECALYLACENGHTEIVRAILNTKRVSLSKQFFEDLYSKLIYVARKNHHLEIPALLLKSAKHNPNISDDDFFSLTANYGSSKEVIQYILEEDKFSEKVDFQLLEKQVENRNISAVKVLLGDPRVDITNHNQSLLLKNVAADFPTVKITKILLNDTRFDPSLCSVYLLSSNGFVTLLESVILKAEFYGEDEDIFLTNSYKNIFKIIYHWYLNNNKKDKLASIIQPYKNYFDKIKQEEVDQATSKFKTLLTLTNCYDCKALFNFPQYLLLALLIDPYGLVTSSIEDIQQCFIEKHQKFNQVVIDADKGANLELVKKLT